MIILVLSDLHIDTGDAFGTFQWKETELISHIENIRNNFSVEKIIFNGDIFELLKYRFDEISRANQKLIKYFRNKDFVFIKGNHDIFNKFGLANYQITNSNGQTIHIEHGHQADWFNGSNFGQALSKIGFSLLKKLSKSKRMMDIYLRIVAFEDQINHIPKKYNRIKYLSYALRLLKEHDVVILGHTHKLESHHTYYLNKKKRYLNCGSCSMGRLQGIIMDTETLHYEMIKENKLSVKELKRETTAVRREMDSLSA
jgi:predicted phosphodiesterase